ncbi:PH domain-containing protein [Nocardioides sp. KR10-350]|uniref:PH domain-containing protein n=1 Tax=Nocardioides cheoyonin TaxID=3156615 RepID=UPI0032B3D201
MPAASEPAVGPALPDLPHTWRPLGPRVMAIVLILGLAAVCAVSWIGFDDETRSRFTSLELGTLGFFGVLILVCVHALTRSRVEARPDHLIIVNGYRRRDLAWAQVVSVNLPPGAPWVNLDLADGTNVPAMGIQASDGARARTAARQLRQLAADLAR